jgi:hypothetical protein
MGSKSRIHRGNGAGSVNPIKCHAEIPGMVSIATVIPALAE